MDEIDVKEVRRWHVEDNGWDDIGYHWLILRDGSIEQGRSEQLIGAHVAGFNSNSVGVALVGGVDVLGNPEFNYTYRQMAALMRLLGEIETRHNITSVTGHNTLSSKADPEFNVEAWYGG
ncbi:UNVERIFIED_CONTAM: hypothetical protein GTU68_007124 [Idotea baltica]|nr:hypothetical protein [Idotea baltica]